MAIWLYDYTSANNMLTAPFAQGSFFDLTFFGYIPLHTKLQGVGARYGSFATPLTNSFYRSFIKYIYTE